LDHKRLVIVADGALQLIPFAVLPDPKNSATNLISNYEIVTLPSASVLALQRRELANRKPAPLSVAVVADPVFDSNDERIVRLISGARGSKRKETKPPASAQALHTAASTSVPDSKADAGLHSALRDVGLDPNALGRLLKSGEEAAEISSVVSRSESFTAIGFQASRAIVMSGKLAQYRNVHFATHGVLDLEHPELSGIVLSRFDEKGQPQDGYLRLYEIYNLNLPADLVVLSACQTGSGKQIRGEGLMALTRGFMYAGAARVVATLWKVDDAATADLMALFYKEMFTNGKRPAAALRDAQIHLSKQKRWSSPYYWGGFVLQGEWR
jgi:CHAT domain-containing protein